MPWSVTSFCLVLLVLGLDWRAVPSLPPASEWQLPRAYRAQANYVEIDAIVTDRDGAFVYDLGPDDFEVLEDGKKQKITVFSVVGHRVKGVGQDSATHFQPADLPTNSGNPDGRVFLLVLDSFHIHSLRTPLLRRRASEFVMNHLRPPDRAAVAHIGYPALNQDFTSNKTLLLESIGTFIGEKPTSAAVAKANADPDVAAGGARKDREARTRRYVAIRSMHSLGELSKNFGEVGRNRKALVFFSEGFDLEFAEHSDLFDEVRAMLGLAARANVSVYPVDPRGLGTIDELIEVRGLVEGSSPPTRALYNELRTEQNSLRTLSDGTGGIAAVASNNFPTAFRRIVEDNSSYYLLGYNTTNTSSDKYRSLAVRVKPSGLQVRARKGYYLESRRTPRQ